MRHEDIPVTRHNDQGPTAFEDAVCVEAPLHIHLNGEPFSITLRTPGEDRALVRGFLLSEGIASALSSDAVNQPAPDRIEVSIPEPFACPNQARRRLASNTSCGLCGNVTLLEPSSQVAPLAASAVTVAASFEPGRLGPLFEQLAAEQALFQKTGGCHAAAAFDASDKLLAAAEDIGRHNAVDKVIGLLLADASLDRAASLLVSGRVSYEITAKCWRAGIPVLAAVSAPSSLAVSLARRLGIRLFGFCRGGKATEYPETADTNHPFRAKKHQKKGP